METTTAAAVAELADAKAKVQALSLQVGEVATTELTETTDRFVNRYQTAMDVRFGCLDRADRIRQFIRLHSAIGRINLDLAWRIGDDLREEQNAFDRRKSNDLESRTWEEYVQQEFGWNVRTASRYISTASFYRHSETFVNTFTSMDEATKVMQTIKKVAAKEEWNKRSGIQGPLLDGTPNPDTHIGEVEGQTQYLIAEFQEDETKTKTKTKTKKDKPKLSDLPVEEAPGLDETDAEETEPEEPAEEPIEVDPEAVYASTLQCIFECVTQAHDEAFSLPRPVPDSLQEKIREVTTICRHLVVQLEHILSDEPAAEISDTSDDVTSDASEAAPKLPEKKKARKGKADAETR